VEGTFASLPFGDGLTTVSGTDLDAYHFATVDHDYEDETDHAQFRQYSEAQGRWLSPDPYGGSYDFTNPQSLNRYVYALNNPLSAVDPSGQNLVDCSWGCGGYSDCANDPNCTAGDDGGGDGGGGAVVDSMPQTIYTTLGSNMLAPCPNNVCSYFNAAGQWMNYQYMVVGAYYASSGPGSIFWNVESAGIAAVEYSDPMSIIAGLEYWGNLYEDQNGVYSFTTGEWGESDSSDFNPYAIPSGTIYVGDYHDHGGFSSPDAEVFSPAGCNGNPNQLCDIGLAMSPLNLGGGIFFLGTPMGRVEMFNPASAGALPNGCVLVGTPVSALAAASPPRPSVPVCQ
jgi:RHS repeat-associated protein